jgi:hypothetical protein
MIPVLISQIEARFDVFLTIDKSFEFEHDLKKLACTRRLGDGAFGYQVLRQLKVTLNELPRDGRAPNQKLIDRKTTLQIIE